jgi:hypothetical protein
MATVAAPWGKCDCLWILGVDDEHRSCLLAVDACRIEGYAGERPHLALGRRRGIGVTCGRWVTRQDDGSTDERARDERDSE